jgi:hypothetical protein
MGSMIRAGRMIGVIVGLLVASLGSAVADERMAALAPPSLNPVQTEHTFNRDLRPRRQAKKSAAPAPATDTRENPRDQPTVRPPVALAPIKWPKDSDIRHRIVTEEVRATPVFGWIAANLWRSKKENGWCLEVDPGDGEYMVLYRKHMN